MMATARTRSASQLVEEEKTIPFEELREKLLIDGGDVACLITPKTIQPTRRHLVGADRTDSLSYVSLGTEPESKDKEVAGGDSEKDKEPKDNPKMAIFYFVLYTMFSTYNLISGKFFRTWYPHMSTF